MKVQIQLGIPPKGGNPFISKCTIPYEDLHRIGERIIIDDNTNYPYKVADIIRDYVNGIITIII